MTCPKCGSENVDIQLVQEQTESKTITHTKSKYREKGHSCGWWLAFGWWWWIVDLFLWIFWFIPRFCIQLFKRKKHRGKSKSTATTKNEFEYKSVCICKNCGHHWEVKK